MTEDVHASVDQLAKLLELAGVAIVLGGIVVAAVLFAYSGLTTRDWARPTRSAGRTLDVEFCWGWSCWSGPTSLRRSRPR